ncbi:hypothetical protein CTY87_00010, partial [Escherichia coli]|nr:hypothetical protein [Escherichia coli]
ILFTGFCYWLGLKWLSQKNK